MKRLISVVVASAMVVGSTGSALAGRKNKRPARPTAAQAYVQQPYAYNQPNVYRRPSNNNGAALAFGLLAIGTIAAIAASRNGNVQVGYGQHYGPQPYPPPGYGYGGYGPAGYGYGAPAYAPPPVVEYERERIVEYRREYERVREVGY